MHGVEPRWWNIDGFFKNYLEWNSRWRGFRDKVQAIVGLAVLFGKLKWVSFVYEIEKWQNERVDMPFPKRSRFSVY